MVLPLFAVTKPASGLRSLQAGQHLQTCCGLDEKASAEVTALPQLRAYFDRQWCCWVWSRTEAEPYLWLPLERRSVAMPPFSSLRTDSTQTPCKHTPLHNFDGARCRQRIAGRGKGTRVPCWLPGYARRRHLSCTHCRSCGRIACAEGAAVASLAARRMLAPRSLIVQRRGMTSWHARSFPDLGSYKPPPLLNSRICIVPYSSITIHPAPWPDPSHSCSCSSH